MKYLLSVHFWAILFLFALVSLLHYVEQLGIAGTISPSFHFGLTRHSLDRILFLVPIVYSGYVFGLIAGLASCSVTLLIMLPRTIFFSPVPQDAILETIFIMVVGVITCVWFYKREKEKVKLRSTLSELEKAHQMLQGYVRSTRENERQLTILNAISNVLTESLQLKKILQKATLLVMELMDVEIVLIYSLDNEAGELALVAYDGISDEFAQAVNRMKIGEGFNGQVARSGQAMLVENASQDPTLSTPHVKKMKIQSQLIVPLAIRERVTGTLCVAMRRPRQFLPKEAELLSAVAGQIATAIENARLYENTYDIAQKLAISEKNYRQLFENASDAIWVHDLTGNITIANQASAKLSGYTIEELTTMNVKDFLSDKGLDLASQIRRNLIDKQPVVQPYEQHMTRKDGTEAVLMLTTSLVTENGKHIAFHNIARDVTEGKRMQENLRYYLSLITQAQEEERKRIARELHDDTSQVLYGLSRQVDNYLRSNTHLAAGDVDFLGEIRQRLNDALEGVRLFSQALRPPMLDDLGLLAAVSWLVDDMQKYMKTKVSLKVSGVERRLPAEAELTLFRTIQEALRNVWKHAQATKAEVAIEFHKSEIRISVSDNGTGFVLNEKMDDLPRSGKLGLAGMDERLRLLGGNLKVQSELGKGATLIAEAPI